jgi:hypothetical protein
MKRAPELVPLSWDHHHGLVMARRIARELPGADDEELAKLYADLVSFWAAGLLPHFRVEGECLLARLLRHVPEGHQTIARTLSDHLRMEALVASMRDTSDIAQRRQLLRTFGERLNDHIRWEESVLFEVAQAELGAQEMAALGKEVAAALPHLVPAPRAIEDRG